MRNLRWIEPSGPAAERRYKTQVSRLRSLHVQVSKPVFQPNSDPAKIALIGPLVHFARSMWIL
jgi:hypothetical protein